MCPQFNKYHQSEFIKSWIDNFSLIFFDQVKPSPVAEVSLICLNEILSVECDLFYYNEPIIGCCKQSFLE